MTESSPVIPSAEKEQRGRLI
jgi:hypothetical protein